MTVTDQETHPRHRGATGVTGKYLSLTTYRRDGSPVSTPVWFAEDDGRRAAPLPPSRRSRRQGSPPQARSNVSSEPPSVREASVARSTSPSY